MYSAQVLNLFLNPKNAGRVMKPEGVADNYNEDQTSNVEFTFRIENNVITDCMFRAQANPYITAVCSIMTEKVKGKRPELAMLTKDEIISEIGEDAENDISFCLECLDLAVLDYRKKFGVETEAIEEEKIEQPAKEEIKESELSSKLDDIFNILGNSTQTNNTKTSDLFTDDDFNLFDDDDLI